MKILLLTILCCIFFLSRASAFEMNGLKSKMSEESALKILSSRGLKMNKFESEKKGESSYLAVRENTDLSEAVTFFNKELVAYQYDVLGSIDSFIRMVSKESLIRGQGIYETKSLETPAGEWNEISIYWIEKNEKFKISYSLINGKAQVVQGYKVINYQ